MRELLYKIEWPSVRRIRIGILCTYWHFVRAVPYYVIESTQSPWDSGSCIEINSCTEEQRGVFGRSNNDNIGINPRGTIGSNFLQVTRQGGFGVFDYIWGTLDLFNRSVRQCHNASISDNPGRDIIFKY